MALDIISMTQKFVKEIIKSFFEETRSLSAETLICRSGYWKQNLRRALWKNHSFWRLVNRLFLQARRYIT